MFEKSKVVVVAVVSREFFPLSLSLSFSFIFVRLYQPTKHAALLPGQLERVHDERPGCPYLKGV